MSAGPAALHPSPATVVVLISGRGSNMRVLVEESRQVSSPYRVTAVVCDQPAAGGIALAHSLGVPAEVLPATPGMARASYDELLAAAIDRHAPALIVLAGFMRILSPPFVERYAGRILNIHPSLLPLLPGLHTHRRALAAAHREHGVTVHFVTAELDGGPGVIQARLAVHPDDSETTLASRVAQLEHRIYPLAVRWYCEGRLHYRDGAAWLDGERLHQPVQYPA